MLYIIYLCIHFLFQTTGESFVSPADEIAPLHVLPLYSLLSTQRQSQVCLVTLLILERYHSFL